MLKHNFAESVGYWILSTAHVIERVANEELAAYGITYRQCQVLGCLALCDEVSQTELAERMQVEPSTLVRILDRMERDGWITREDCPSDRRKKLIRPTAKVEPVWANIIVCGKRIQERATKSLSISQVKELKNVLDTVRANLGDRS